ncbi:MAG: hypothetical protein QG620_407 [Patescibacteria group bacterium]|nr:hypothetical protein [Patescibacteria group bacterium]
MDHIHTEVKELIYTGTCLDKPGLYKMILVDDLKISGHHSVDVWRKTGRSTTENEREFEIVRERDGKRLFKPSWTLVIGLK